MRPEWTAEQIRDLGTVTDIVTAGAILGIGRTTSYELARTGEFPVPIMRVGHRYRVATAALCELLGISPLAPSPEPVRSGTRVQAGPSVS